MVDLVSEPRVWEESTTTGTVTFELDGISTAEKALRSFVGAGLGGKKVIYMIQHQSADEHEFGVGTVTDATPDTLSRDKVYRSSNSDAKVSFSAGTKDVFLFDWPGFGLGAVHIITGNTTLGIEHGTVFTNLLADATLTLPDAGDFFGKEYVIHANTGSSEVLTIQRSGSDFITSAYNPSGSFNSIELRLRESVTLKSAGGNRWNIIHQTFRPHTCLVTLTSNQSIPNNSLTAVNFTTESFDEFGLHDNSTNTNRITISRGGKYLIGAGSAWASNNTGVRFLVIRKDGTTELARDRKNAAAESEATITKPVELSSGNYIELLVYQNSGGSLNLASGEFSNLWVAEQR